MPYRPEIIADLPDWIDELAGGDPCLEDVFTEAWVASLKARKAMRQRGGGAPRTCGEEFKAAKGILDAIRTGRVPHYQLVEKASQAIRKFATARQCARFLEHDDSPKFAQEPRALATTTRRQARFVERARR